MCDPNPYKFAFATIVIVMLTFKCTKREKACFDYSPANPNTTTGITFNSGCSENTYSNRWTFGDGTPDTTSTSLTINHKYSSAGVYTVTLNAERKDGVTLRKGLTTVTKTITVQ